MVTVPVRRAAQIAQTRAVRARPRTPPYWPTTCPTYRVWTLLRGSMLAVVTVIALIGVALVLFAAAVLSTRDGGQLADAPPDAADTGLPAGMVQPEDVAGVRFAMAPRGYRMAEVDEVLDRLAGELADRDRRLALLEASITGGMTPADEPAGDVVQAGEQDLPIVGTTTGERPEPPSGVPLSTWHAPPTATPAAADTATSWTPQPITQSPSSGTGPEAPAQDTESSAAPTPPYAPDDPR